MGAVLKGTIPATPKAAAAAAAAASHTSLPDLSRFVYDINPSINLSIHPANGSNGVGEKGGGDILLQRNECVRFVNSSGHFCCRHLLARRIILRIKAFALARRCTLSHSSSPHQGGPQTSHHRAHPSLTPSPHARYNPPTKQAPETIASSFRDRGERAGGYEGYIP